VRALTHFHLCTALAGTSNLTILLYLTVCVCRDPFMYWYQDELMMTTLFSYPSTLLPLLRFPYLLSEYKGCGLLLCL
jgi:hypothetical protein